MLFLISVTFYVVLDLGHLVCNQFCLHHHNRHIYVALFKHSLLTALYRMFLKIDVFNFTLNAAVIIDDNVRCCGSAFHRLGAATMKARSPQ